MNLRERAISVSCVLIASVCVCPAQQGGKAGAFARMGFGARGVGMGNAMSAVATGLINTHYNPAVAPFVEGRYASAAFGILSLDRSLNFLSYTQSAKPTAGIAFGIINSGVGEIDGRDNDGAPTSTYSTSENQFFLTFANKFAENVALGITVKLYYNKLFEDLSATSIAFDFGALYRLTDRISLGAVVQDLRARYQWDTSTLYGQAGNTTRDEFPLLRRVAASYRLPNERGMVSAEFENSDGGTNVFRLGAEFYLAQNVSVRGGLDRIDPDRPSDNAKPSFGVSFEREVSRFTPSVNYAYVFESFAPNGMHIVDVSVKF